MSSSYLNDTPDFLGGLKVIPKHYSNGSSTSSMQKSWSTQSTLRWYLMTANTQAYLLAQKFVLIEASFLREKVKLKQEKA